MNNYDVAGESYKGLESLSNRFYYKKLKITPENIVETTPIVNTGFDPTYSKIAVYGMGTYASPSAKVATGYCKDVRAVGDFSMIFLCRFIKGLHGKGNNQERIDIEKMDYCGEHDILVTPYADGIVPDYLICYYKWDT